MGANIMEADKEEAMGVEVEVEEAKEGLQGEEEDLTARTQHIQLSNVPSVDSLMKEEDVTGQIHVAEFTSVAGV